ncbi:MAG: apolipoprotein N-acyltransferase [Christensenellaceae bacterium]
MKKRIVPILICAGSGLLCGICFDVAQLSFLAWVCIAPMFFVLFKNKDCLKKVMLYAGIFCLALFAYYDSAFFMLNVETRIQNSVLWLILGFLTVVAVQGGILWTAIVAGIKINCHPAIRSVLIAILWTAAEWVCGVGAFGLPCVRMGLTQWAFAYGIGSASVFGVLFISFLMILVNVLIAQAMAMKSKKPIAIALAICAANLIFGAVVMHKETADVSVSAVQYNVPFYADGQGSGREEKAVALAKNAQQQAPTQLVFLPENTLSGSFAQDIELQNQIRSINKNAYILTGVYGLHGFEMRNSVFMTSPNGEVSDAYNKQRLVPIFENGYEKEFSMQIGNERGIFDTAYGKIGAVICFESLFSQDVSQSVRQGAQLMSVFTNDSWFTNDIPLYRHFHQSVLRAVETNRYVVHASNNGITGFIANNGEVLSTLEPNIDGVAQEKIAFISGSTPYVFMGDWWIAVVGGAVGLFMITKYLKKNKH